MDFKAYLAANARKLDVRLYEHLFENTDAQSVLEELRKYQNSDGGFGHSLESDLRLPSSSALATVVALQYVAKVNSPAYEIVEKAVRYLVTTYNVDKQGWINIPPQADEYPRAPWWNYAYVLSWAGWGNPSAEILGYLLECKAIVSDQPFLNKISDQAIGRLNAITEPEQHEVKCYIRLYERSDKNLQAKLHNKIASHIKMLAKTSPKDWEGYAATPLTFIDSPESPFADVFDKNTLIENAHFIKAQLMGCNHWEPTWEWGQFEDEWVRAKKEWSGKLTVDNLLVLKAFGVGLDG